MASNFRQGGLSADLTSKLLSEDEKALAVSIEISRQRKENVQKPWDMTGNNLMCSHLRGRGSRGRRQRGKRQTMNICQAFKVMMRGLDFMLNAAKHRGRPILRKVK